MRSRHDISFSLGTAIAVRAFFHIVKVNDDNDIYHISLIYCLLHHIDCVFAFAYHTVLRPLISLRGLATNATFVWVISFHLIGRSELLGHDISVAHSYLSAALAFSMPFPCRFRKKRSMPLVTSDFECHLAARAWRKAHLLISYIAR